MNAKDWTPQAIRERVAEEGLRLVIDVCEHEDGSWWAIVEDVHRIAEGDGMHVATASESGHRTPEEAAQQAIRHWRDYNLQEKGPSDDPT